MISADYLIIGTGPIGVFSAKYLLKKGKKVIIVDNASKKNKTVNLELNLKDAESKEFVYDFENTANYKNKKTLPISSKIDGGFTRVWGGTLNKPDKNEIEKLGISENQYLEFYFSILNDIPHIKYNNFYKHFNQPSTKYYEIEEPLIGIGSSLDEVWSSTELLNNLIKEYKNSIKYLNYIDVEKIIDKKDCFRLNIKNDYIEFDVKKVLVCAGVFSSTKIASNMLGADLFSIEDSELSVWPVFKFGKKISEDKSKLTNSHFSKDKAFVKLIIKFIRNNTSIKSQVYEFNQELITTLLNRLGIFGKLFLPLINILKKRLYLIFVYKDSYHSKKSLFKIDEENKIQIENVQNPKFKLNVFSYFFRYLRLSFLLIPIKYKFKNYGSFHSGNSIFYKNGKEYVFDDVGSLKGFDDIHFIDSAVMKFIPSGPFTISSIVISKSILNILIND